MPFNIVQLSIKHLQLVTAVVPQNNIKYYSAIFCCEEIGVRELSISLTHDTNLTVKDLAGIIKMFLHVPF